MLLNWRYRREREREREEKREQKHKRGERYPFIDVSGRAV